MTPAVIYGFGLRQIMNTRRRLFPVSAVDFPVHTPQPLPGILIFQLMLWLPMIPFLIQLGAGMIIHGRIMMVESTGIQHIVLPSQNFQTLPPIITGFVQPMLMATPQSVQSSHSLPPQPALSFIPGTAPTSCS